jgi:hypothetical protein
LLPTAANNVIAGQLWIRYAKSRIVFISVSYSLVKAHIVFLVYRIHIQVLEYEYAWINSGSQLWPTKAHQTAPKYGIEAWTRVLSTRFDVSKLNHPRSGQFGREQLTISTSRNFDSPDGGRDVRRFASRLQFMPGRVAFGKFITTLPTWLYLNTLRAVSYFIHIVLYSYSVVFIFNGSLQGRIVFVCIWIYSKFNLPYRICGQH